MDICQQISTFKNREKDEIRKINYTFGNLFKQLYNSPNCLNVAIV